MARTFAYRLLLMASWGIAIDLTARSTVATAVSAELLRAGDRTWMDISQVTLLDDEREQLRFGLSVAAPAIERRLLDGQVVIEVLALQFSPPDYQTEGLAAAMLGWATEEFGLDPPDVQVEFDKEKRRYVYHW